MKPSDFTEYPWSSVCRHCEDEVVAQNIMIILKRTGNEFRDLTWKEYKKERLKDGNFTMEEKECFEKVIWYCKSEKKARLFSKYWNKTKSKQHWYRQYVGECPVCGRNAGWKERVYGEKPEDTTEIYIQLKDTETYDHCMG